MSVTDNAGNAITDGTNIALVNPYRYRSYYYDTETSLYYLNSRYYNPEVGRFINADEVIFIATYEKPAAFNLFSYCVGDPVCMYDPAGFYATSLTLSSSIITSMSGALSSIMSSVSVSVVGIKVAIAISWFVIICVAAVAVAMAGIISLIKRISSIAASASSVINAVKNKLMSKGVDTNKLGNYTVYVITKNGTYDVVYVGITKNYTARKSQHTGKNKRFPSKSFTMTPIATGLSKSQARAMEQTLITAYTIDTLRNMINSISPKKWKNFKSEFEQMKSLLDSWVDPE